MDIGSGSPVITAFFVHQAQANVVGGFSTAASRAKASALFEGSQKLSSSWNPSEFAVSHARRWLWLTTHSRTAVVHQLQRELPGL